MTGDRVSEYPELDAIEARANAATPGEWRASFYQRWDGGIRLHDKAVRAGRKTVCDGRSNFPINVEGGIQEWRDLTFIAAARTDVPRLAKALRIMLGDDFYATEYERRKAALAALEGDREGALGELKEKDLGRER